MVVVTATGKEMEFGTEEGVTLIAPAPELPESEPLRETGSKEDDAVELELEAVEAV